MSVVGVAIKKKNLALRAGADVPVAAGAGDNRLSSRQLGRHDRLMGQWLPERLVQTLVIESASFVLQAEDGIRDYKVTGVQTCALPISRVSQAGEAGEPRARPANLYPSRHV